LIFASGKANFPDGAGPAGLSPFARIWIFDLKPGEKALVG